MEFPVKVLQKSKITLIAMGLVALKATVFQVEGMESTPNSQTEQGIAIDSFDALLAQTPIKSADEILKEISDVHLEFCMDGIKSGINLLPQREIFGPDFQEQIFFEIKDICSDVYREVYKDCTYDQLKILYAFVSSPLTRNVAKTLVQQLSNSWDYLRYGIAHYNKYCVKTPESKVLTLVGKNSGVLSKLLVREEEAISHFRWSRGQESISKTHSWDGTIPDTIWSQIIESKYPDTILVVNYDVFTYAQRKNILDHAINKSYSDLLEKHPQAVAIENDFLDKHESLYFSCTDQMEALFSERIQPIMVKLMLNKMEALDMEEQEAMFGSPRVTVTIGKGSSS